MTIKQKHTIEERFDKMFTALYTHNGNFREWSEVTMEVKQFFVSQITQEKQELLERVRREFARGVTRDEVNERLDSLVKEKEI